MRRRRIVADRRHRSCRLQLPPDERLLLAALPAELARTLQSGGDPGGESPGGGAPGDPGDQPPGGGPAPEALRRLFPRAYTSDDDAETAFADATRGELVESRRAALETLARTANATSLTTEEVNDWLRALTDIRLVLGTMLGVTDDGSVEHVEDDSSEAVVYRYLTYLQAELIEVLSRWLPDPIPGSDEEIPEDPWGEPLGGLRWDGTPQPTWPAPPESGTKPPRSPRSPRSEQ